jgi:glycosyltransferase involved in cell wall biosynthesis|eukprot:COSAG01_NODE_4317_length_5137_cov_16.810441_5_plen_167_part_00
MLDETITYLQRRQRRDPKFVYEIVVVDDGSPIEGSELWSKTTTCALEFSRKYTTDVIRVLTLRQNRGKGFAVKTGMMHARGELLVRYSEPCHGTCNRCPCLEVLLPNKANKLLKPLFINTPLLYQFDVAAHGGRGWRNTYRRPREFGGTHHTVPQSVARQHTVVKW